MDRLAWDAAAVRLETINCLSPLPHRTVAQRRDDLPQARKRGSRQTLVQRPAVSALSRIKAARAMNSPPPKKAAAPEKKRPPKQVPKSPPLFHISDLSQIPDQTLVAFGVFLRKKLRRDGKKFWQLSQLRGQVDVEILRREAAQ